MSERPPGRLAQVAEQHRRPTEHRCRNTCGTGDPVAHHTVERTLPQTAGEQTDEVILLVLGESAEQVDEQAVTFTL